MSRRKFLKDTGVVSTGLALAPFGRTRKLHAAHQEYSAQVAATLADNYERAFIKQKVQHLFEALGGISDIVKAGDKVAMKINITGGSEYVGNPRLNGLSVCDTIWTHPEVIRATGELLIDSGINANDLYIVEALYDWASYSDFGYKEVQESLGCQFVDLNNQYPYSDYMERELPETHYFYDKFTLNRIFDEIDVFVSIPKMKQNYNAGFTHSMKNLIGIVPSYEYGGSWRKNLHFDGGNIRTHLPRSIVDLNIAQPVHLAVIDGVKNAIGGGVPLHDTFEPYEHHLLLASKNSVAIDAVAARQMGDDPEAEQIMVPAGELADNHLHLANLVGLGPNKLEEIELVGDGADALIASSVDDVQISQSQKFRLYQNYPNPFNPSTNIRYWIPENGFVVVNIYNVQGGLVKRLVDEEQSVGYYSKRWNATNNEGVKVSSGIYIYSVNFIGDKHYNGTGKMLLVK